jgi:S-adenosylmethionine-diacylgycerolhomoserine-N-methlytransferase
MINQNNTAKKMDRIYWWQVFIYDGLRKYYLLGRDKLLNSLNLVTENVCEIGCGTGRNLIFMANRYPQATFWGIEPSSSMISYAKARIVKKKLDNRITLVEQDAENLNSVGLLPNTTPKFDRILFSYTLSMIPDFKVALQSAISNLKSGGYLHIVDFSNHSGCNKLTQKLHTLWLALFSVHYNPEIYPYLKEQSILTHSFCDIQYSPAHYYEIITYKKEG